VDDIYCICASAGVLGASCLIDVDCVCGGYWWMFRWVLLTVTWYLAAGRGWTHEAMQRWSSFLHLAAWGVPAAQTIGILVLTAVDADELTGMCYVGNQSHSFLLAFVIGQSSNYPSSKTKARIESIDMDG